MKELITFECYRNTVEGSSKTEEEKGTALMISLMSTISTQPQLMNELINVFKRIEPFQQVAIKLYSRLLSIIINIFCSPSPYLRLYAILLFHFDSFLYYFGIKLIDASKLLQCICIYSSRVEHDWINFSSIQSHLLSFTMHKYTCTCTHLV